MGSWNVAEMSVLHLFRPPRELMRKVIRSGNRREHSKASEKTFERWKINIKTHRGDPSCVGGPSSGPRFGQMTAKPPLPLMLL